MFFNISRREMRSLFTHSMKCVMWEDYFICDSQFNTERYEVSYP